MAIKIKKPKELVSNQYVNAVIYGPSGIGKSFCIPTAPKPLILSSEEGLLSIQDADIDVIEIKSIHDIDEVLKWLHQKCKEGKCEYETIVLDSISELAQQMLHEYKKDERDPRRAYMTLAETLLEKVRFLKAMPAHIVFIAKQSIIVDEYTGKTFYGPLLPGRVLPIELPYQVDEVLAMRFVKHNGKDYRVFQTQPDIQYSAKDRSGKLKQYERPHLGQLFNKILGKAESEPEPEEEIKDGETE